MATLIKATYYGNTAEECRHIIASYLHYTQFGKLIEEHPQRLTLGKHLHKYKSLAPFEGWWNEYISDEESHFIEED